MPVLLYASGAWSVRAEFRNPDTGTSLGVVETPPEKSSLTKDVVYRHAAAVSAAVAEYFERSGSLSAAVRSRVRRLVRRLPSQRLPRLRSLDAAVSFERGLDAFEQLELSTARAAFSAAAGQDPRNPVPQAWRSRTATLMRQDRDAIDAAETAQRLLRDEIRPRDRLWTEAIVFETRRDAATAEARYRELMSRYPDEPLWRLELAGYLDRRGSASEAVEIYHQALAADQGLVLAHLELCRLYSPSRLNEPALAKEQGQLTLTMARDLGNRALEARALMCLTDVRRSGTETERKEARRDAEEALRIVEQLHYPFGTALALNYLSIVALLAEQDASRAVPLLERALAAGRQVGFVRLEMRVLMNLAVAHEALGYRSLALKEYRQGTKLAEDVGSQQDAAYNQANAAAILIDYSTDPNGGLRDAENALGVFQQTGEKDFEAHAREVIASYQRRAGNHEEATRQINLGLDIARQHGLEDKQARLTIELARVRFDLADYAQARDLLRRAESFATGRGSIPRRVQLGRTLARLGEFETARGELTRLSSEIEHTGDRGSQPVVQEALGELDYEMGRLNDARAHFVQSSTAWSSEDLVDEASVTARAYAGLLEGLRGNTAQGRAEVLESLGWARQTHRVALQAQCALFLSRLALSRGDEDEAVRRLDEMSDALWTRVNPELQAQRHYWRSQVLERRGDRGAAAAARQTARGLLGAWRDAVISSSDASNVQLRPDLRLILRDEAAARP
jgi:tetratricopeptide (TPR) repeat protein